MKFTCSVDINQPIDKVIELFDSVENMKEWQDGFVSYEHLSGTEGGVGAKAKLKYEMRGKKIELIETITVKDFPNEFSGLYENKNMTNTMQNKFSALSEDTCRWDATIEYTSFNAVIPKLMAWLMPNIFRNQTQKWLDQFKEFAERS